MDDSSIDRSLKWYAAREPLVLLILSTMAVIFFLAVAGLSRIYHAQRESMGQAWYTRAASDLQAGRLDRAVGEFRAAEQYSRGNFHYQLSLAQALAAQGNNNEAYSYLLNLREQRPDDGTVNLELARILAKRGDASQTIRYYHNALYSIWPTEPEVQRRTVRLELIEFLLAQNSITQAQSELIALAGSLPSDSALHVRVGSLFLDAKDPEHALAQFRDALKTDRRDPAALAGAGQAAYDLGSYASAKRYLQSAVSVRSDDGASAHLLAIASLVLEMDPFRRQISSTQRYKSVLAAFDAAGDRIQACSPSTGGTQSVNSGDPQKSLATRWKELKPQVNPARLGRDPELVDSVMDFVFTIEQQPHTTCLAPTEKDQALLLISKLHEGNEK